MASVRKLAVMAGSLAVVLFAITVLRDWLGDAGNQSQPSLAIEAEPTATDNREAAKPRILTQPRILQAKPSVGQESSSPPYRERLQTGSADAENEPTWSVPLSPSLSDVEDRSRFDEPQPLLEDRTPKPPAEFPRIPNPLAEDLLDTATQLQGGTTSGWPPDEQAEDTTIWTARENDSLWDISIARYGTGGYYHALFAQNRARIPRPDRISAGVTLETPDAATLRKRFPALCPAEPLDQVAPAVSHQPAPAIPRQ